MLAGPNGLAVLLLDPHVRDHLLRPGTLIPRLAASLLADRREGDPERPLTFTTEDLPLDILDVKKASEVAQKRLMLIKTRAELQEAAVAMLNEQLPVAVTNAGNIGSGRLQSALLKIRREFARQGKEIILLIEDFALIQGIQRDLLDAIIEVGERDGRVVMAPVRTLMAVTTGYYSRLADTVLTRAKAATPYVYDLDVQFDASEEGMAEIVAFVGRYLNAARLGREKLDAEGVRSARDVPNFCDGCDYRHAMPSGLRVLLRRARHLPVQRDRTASRDPRASRTRKIRMRSIRGPSSEKWYGTSSSSTASPSRRVHSRTLTSGRSTPPRPLSRLLPSTVHDLTGSLGPAGSRPTGDLPGILGRRARRAGQSFAGPAPCL